jgi:formylmethanofuran dehydrogenase subunit E
MALAFHGHGCPGLSIGIRAAELCLRDLGHNDDGTLVAVVETDSCGVDAIQALTGCTIGKGNLIHRDYGKMAFSFYRRLDGKSFRAIVRPEIMCSMRDEMRGLYGKVQAGLATKEESQRCDELRDQIDAIIMNSALEELFIIDTPQRPMPSGPMVLESLKCHACGEMTMESRTRRIGGRDYCIPCFEAREQKS